jgi:hypothetical protein
MDCVSPSTERFYTPLLGPDRDPLDKDPLRSLVQPALLMPLLPKGIYPLFDKLYKSIQAFAKEH